MAEPTLRDWLIDARGRTLALVADLSDAQLFGPRLAIVNPLHWEIGHVAWFGERWILRHALGEPPLRADGDALYDSSAIPHDTRWDLPLPSRAQTVGYLQRTLERSLEALPRLLERSGGYFAQLATFHEDMHDEAFLYTRQTLEYPRPPALPTPGPGAGPHPGDVAIPGGAFRLGAPPEAVEFVFDNEKWEHPVEVAPFRIARAPVTQGELAAFVDAGGYRDERLWSAEGWRWRSAVGAEHPLHWRAGDGWARRDFDRWVPLEPHRPAIHVNWHEAQAYCRWAQRRLPTELEWEVAASGEPDGRGGLREHRRSYPWGEAPPDPTRANLDSAAGACLDVAALPAGDSAFGCRQLLGNVWEWTASTFEGFPGFAPDPYRDYSAPWFGDHQVLKGGAWMTRGRMIRNRYRNFYKPDRRDVWAGFRTCALTA